MLISALVSFTWAIAPSPIGAAPQPPSLVVMVQERGGRPLESAWVMARPEGAPDADALRGLTDKAGILRLSMAVRPLGTLRVTAGSKGYENLTLTNVRMGAAPLRLTLDAAKVFAGTVLDAATRAPISGATIVLTPEALVGPTGTPLGDSTNEPYAFGVQTTRTDLKGRFVLSDLGRAVRSSLRVAAEGYRAFEQSGLKGQPPAVVVLSKGCWITGIVSDAAGKPLPGVTVLVDKAVPTPGPPVVATTSSQGLLQVPGLAPTRYEIIYLARGYALGHAFVDLTETCGGTGSTSLAPGFAGEGRVVDSQGQPIPSARVELRAVEGAALPAVAVAAYTGTSDRDGYVVLRDLPAADLRISASAEGFAAEEFFVRIDAAAATKTHRIDVGDLTLQRGLAVRGQVKDELDGIAIPGATIRVAQGQEQRPVQTSSGPDGTFGVRVDAPGAYLLAAEAAGYRRVLRDVVADVPTDVILPRSALLIGRVLDDQGAVAQVSITATAGREQTDGRADGVFAPAEAFTDGDGRFELPAPFSVTRVTVLSESHQPLVLDAVSGDPGKTVDLGDLRLSSGVGLEVSVVDTDGQPVATASVRVRPVGERERTPGSVDREGTTDADGRVRFRGLAAGLHALLVHHPDFAEAVASEARIGGDQGITETRVVLESGASVAGTIRYRSGRPLGVASVHAFGASGQSGRRWVPGGSESVPVLEDGSFLIPHAPMPEVRLLLIRRSEDGQIEVGPSKVVDTSSSVPVDWVLSDVLLSGRVVRNGVGVPNVRIRDEGPGPSLGPGARSLGDQTFRGWAVSGEDGWYRMLLDEPGATTLRLELPSGVRVTRSIEVADAAEVAQDLNLDQQNIRGQVVDAATGAPLPQARISVRPGGQIPVDAEGRFEAPVPEGDGLIVVNAPGYAQQNRPLLPADTSAEWLFSLIRGTRIGGRVLDATGRPTPNFKLYVSVTNVSSSTDSTGRFVLEDLPAGVPFIYGGSEAQGFVVDSNAQPGTEDAVLSAQPGTPVLVRVEGPDGGAPPIGTMIMVITINDVGVSPRVFSWPLGSGGGQREVVLPRGRIGVAAISIDGSRQLSASAQVETVSGEAETLVLKLR